VNGFLSIILVAGWIVIILVFLQKLNRAKAAESASNTIRSGKPKPSQWNARSVGLKMGGSAGIAASVVVGSVFWVNRPGGGAKTPLTLAELLGYFLFAAATGAIIGYVLALRDLILERQARGQRIHPVLRAYFSSGLVSVFLWSVTGFVAGIGGILFYYAFLSPGVGSAAH